jgi:hypothetical protein
MFRPMRRLYKPVSESRVVIALAVSALVMALMLWGIIWQANIIVYQRAVIRSLFSARVGG